MTAGWKVHSFRDLRERFIVPARSRGTARSSLDNPAKPLLDFLAANSPLAVVGVSIRTPADLRDVYGYLVEPAYRRDLSLLISSDRDLDDLEPESFVDPVGYPWTLERLEHVASRFRLGPAPDGLPPMTPIEAILFQAMRGRGLTPVAQYGIGKFRADFAFTDVRLVVECDGRQWHDPDRDRVRDAALRRMGWETLHFTGSEIVMDAASCVARVATALAHRRATAESEQPYVFVPLSRSWWARFKEWLRNRFAKAAATEVMPADVGPLTVNDPGRPAPWTDDLDAEQRAAVLSSDGVVQVIAPAGSGKTTVLVARVRELVARGVPPNRILCCTFNKAAAVELQARLEQAGVEGVDADTFHATGRKILKQADLLPGDVLTISFAQWRRLAKLALDQTPDGVWIEAAAAKDQISDLKLGRMMTADEFAEIAVGSAEQTLATLYRLYEAELIDQKRTDFDDFIFGAVRLLQRDASARHHWQGEFTAVLVDEYQDIEPAQELLVQMLAAPEDLLLCVGDEDQCLYAWRRASVERVIELDQLYPGLERHALARNYRCPVSIVDASRGLIEHNHRRFPKRILAGSTTPGTITLAAAADLEAQGAHAARIVKDLDQGQAVILARTTRVLSGIALGLAQEGIRFFGPERIKRRLGEAATLIAYLRVLGSRDLARPEDVDRMFQVPNRYLPDGAEDNVASALRSGQTFAAAIGRLRVHEDWRRRSLSEAAELFDVLGTVTDASTLVHRLRTDGGLDRHYAEAENLSPADRSAVDSLEQAEETAAGMSVTEFAGALDYQANIIEQHFDRKGIELATIHGAKGRQWPLVIVAGVEEGELPHARSLENAADPIAELEGERRLAYVAFTRAQRELLLMYKSERPSRFIAEAALAVDAGGSSEPNSVDSGDPAPFAARAGARPDGWAGVRTGRRNGGIPCSVPGCTGVVGRGYVITTATERLGICGLSADHERLVASDPAARREFDRLKNLDRERRRDWARRNAPLIGSGSAAEQPPDREYPF